MSVNSLIDEWLGFDCYGYLERVTGRAVELSLSKNKLTPLDLLNLLSPAAESYLEPMAARAREITVQRFGKVVQLYIPLYLSNSCLNSCVYCGFSARNKIERKTLSVEEIGQNARAIAALGMKHILLLTGEDTASVPIDYLESAIRLLRTWFASVSMEVYPMDSGQYRRLRDAGLDGITIYQETYDPVVYDRVHPAGRKRDYCRRLDTPERAAQAGLRTVGLGVLFGLAEPVRDGFLAALHAGYLQQNYRETEFSLSLPRMNEAEGSSCSGRGLDDRKFVQMLAAYRIFLPTAGITISTRESAEFRDRILPLGVTRISAGSLTAVGAYADACKNSTPQFSVSDNRSVGEIVSSVVRAGYDPVYKDWQAI